jgi:hypothetical protein
VPCTHCVYCRAFNEAEYALYICGLSLLEMNEIQFAIFLLKQPLLVLLGLEFAEMH